MAYDTLGSKTIVPQADLENLVSRANKNGDTRMGGDALGKKDGMEVLCKLTSDDSLKMVMALGHKSSDAWRVVDGSANITPVNLSTWTVGADSTYSAGLLTTDGGNDAAGRVSQAVVLKAGTYFVSGEAAREGSAVDYVSPRLRITGSVTTTIATKVFKGAIHATAAEDADPKEDVGFSFTIPSDQTVTFTLDIVDETALDATLGAGSAYLSLNALESY